MNQAQLLQVCVLPGCKAPVVGEGEACPGCVAAFGSWLHRGDGPAMTAAQVEERDSAALAAVRAQQVLAALHPPVAMTGPDGPERKRNQTCWLCEERRTCTRTPDGWECDTCRQVTG